MKAAIIGYGKMGREIEKVLLRRGHSIAAIIDTDNYDDLSAGKLLDADVVIEFTAPDQAFRNITACLRIGIPVVSGTTGWQNRLEEAEALCRQLGGTLFYASNFSIGMNIFFNLNKHLARLMNTFPDYEVSMTEIHHAAKKDAPSGTAVTLAEDILTNLDRKSSWVNHETLLPETLGILSLREGEVPGTHTVKYRSENDEIIINHISRNRGGLALGAVLAAEYAATHKGILSMRDLLGL